MTEKQKHTENTVYFKQSFWQLLRPLTISGTMSPVLVANALAFFYDAFSWVVLCLTLIAAFCIQVSGNMLNDYFDYQRGQDQDRWVKEPETAEHGPSFEQVPWIAAGFLVTAGVLGFFLAVLSGWWVLVAGAVGVAASIAYSAGGNFSFSSLGLGELVVGLFMGLATFLLAFAVQTGTVTLTVFLAGLVFACLIATLVLANNIRDMKKDFAFRETVPHRVGRQSAFILFIILLCVVYGVVLILSMFSSLSLWMLVVFLALPVASRALYAFRKTATLQDEQKGMKWAALHHWTFSLLWIISLWVLNLIHVFIL